MFFYYHKDRNNREECKSVYNDDIQADAAERLSKLEKHNAKEAAVCITEDDFYGFRTLEEFEEHYKEENPLLVQAVKDGMKLGFPFMVVSFNPENFTDYTTVHTWEVNYIGLLQRYLKDSKFKIEPNYYSSKTFTAADARKGKMSALAQELDKLEKPKRKSKKNNT